MSKALSERIKEEIASQLGQFLILDDRMPERVEVSVRYGQMDARLRIDLRSLQVESEGCGHG